MKKILGIFFGLLVFTASLVLLYLGMRSVMAIGGYCAEGGPYQIAVHCPKGVSWLMPLSIFAMMGGGGLYTVFATKAANGPQWYYFFWSALFGSLGWNFLDFAIHAPKEMSDAAIGWWVCAVLFILMAGVPLLGIIFGSSEKLLGKQALSFSGILLGQSTGNVPIGGYVNQNLLVAVHAIALVAGIFLGLFVFNALT